MASSLTVTVGGQVVLIREQSLQISDRIDDKIKCRFTVLDPLGAAILQHGQPVSVVDTILGTLFTGFVDKPTATNLFPSQATEWGIDCVGHFYVPAKKTSKRTHQKQHSGVIAAQQIQQYLEPDGISGNFGLDFLELLSDWQTGTQSGVVATTKTSTGNVGAGDLELVTAGNQVQFQQSSQADFNAGTTGQGLSSPASGGVTLTPTPAIKLVATVSVPGISGAFTYVKIWDKILGTYTIPTTFPTLFYDVWIADSCPEQKAGVEIVCTDGTSYQQAISNWNVDQQGASGAIATDLSGLATNQWYHRILPLYGFGTMGGKTIQSVSVAFGGSKQGTYTAYFRTITIANYDGSSPITILSSASTVIPVVPQQLQNNGYNGMSCALVTTYERHGFMASPLFALSAAALVGSSYLHWVVSLPTSDFTLTVTATLDLSTFLPCTNNGPIPGLLPGANLTGKSVAFGYTMDNHGNDPTLTPRLSSIAGNVTPAFPCTKTDSATLFNTATGWGAGTLTNLIQNATSGALQLNGNARSWAAAVYYGGQTLYGAGSPSQGVLSGQLFLTCGPNPDDARSRFDFAGQWADFTAEVDLQVTTGVLTGLVYRTTNWQTNDGTWAYAIEVDTASIKLQRGPNSGTTFSVTTIGTASLALQSGAMHHLKIVVAGSSHQIYLDSFLALSVTDGTFTGAGYLGVRNRNTLASTQTALFANFGVAAALSGTWLSPAIDLHAVGTVSASQLLLQIDPSAPFSLLTYLAEISLNNGSTWTTCPNAVAATAGYYQTNPVPGLAAGAGVGSVTAARVRLTITATTASLGTTGSASIAADLFAVSLWVIGPYSSAGFRTNAPLAWDSMDRLAVASGFGVASDLQTYSQVGTATTALATSGEATITNTSGDVHLRLGSKTAGDQEATVRFALSAATISAGVELRYSSSSVYYRLAATTSSLSISKNTGGGPLTLATTALTITAGTFYRLRFRVTGVLPVSLQGRVWPDGTAEPAGWTVIALD